MSLSDNNQAEAINYVHFVLTECNGTAGTYSTALCVSRVGCGKFVTSTTQVI